LYQNRKQPVVYVTSKLVVYKYLLLYPSYKQDLFRSAAKAVLRKFYATPAPEKKDAAPALAAPISALLCTRINQF
jgi:hypothetical protein